MGWAVVLLALLTYCTGIDGQPTWSQPSSSSVSLGGTVKISCITQNTNTISWNQQRSGEAPRFVHCDGCNRGEGIPDRFTATRSGSTGYLTITNAQAEDEADYYCVSWYSAGNGVVFGTGTQLTVLGQPTVSPSLQAFAPSQEEMKSHNKATLVCLLSEFYPPAFDLQWKADGQVITSGVETTKAFKQGGKYMASSYMNMGASDFERHGVYACEVTHEGKTITKSVSPSGSC